jgi:hypothetical protein
MYSSAIVYQNNRLSSGIASDQAAQWEQEGALRDGKDPKYIRSDFTPIATVNLTKLASHHPALTGQILAFVWETCQSHSQEWWRNSLVTVVKLDHCGFRSLCVGDVICLSYPEKAQYKYFAIAPFGFVPIVFQPPETTDNEDQRIQLSCWTCKQAESLVIELAKLGIATSQIEDWNTENPDYEGVPLVFVFMDLWNPDTIVLEQINAVCAAHHDTVLVTRSWLGQKNNNIIEELIV